MRVLATSVPAGSGHVRAAEALCAAIKKHRPDMEAVHVQVTDLVSASFRKIYVDGYRLTINRAPSLWGKIYNYWDNTPPESRVTPLLYGVQRFCSGAFYSYIDRFRPQVILTTHFLIPQLLAARRGPGLRPPIESVITDYDVHRFWVSDQVSRYYVAQPGMIETLMRYGVSRDQIVVSGIPVHPQFSERYSPSAIFRSLGLAPEKPVILLLSGGFGLQQLAEGVKHLLRLPMPVQIVTVSGRNEALRQKLEAVVPPANMRLLHLGYVRNMPELLTISDLVITKPGGLSVSECLAKKKIMILFPALPGQEQRNADFLLSHQAAVQVRTLEDLLPEASRLLNDRPRREQILSNIEQHARPHAAFTIVQSLSSANRLAA